MEKNKKIMFLSTLIVGIIVLSTGITYSLFTDSRTSKNSQLVMGDIYMHYNENNQINMSGVGPTNTYDATKYFEFTVDGKNTTTNKDIWYEINLVHGDNHATRTTRLKDSLLKFRLTEVSDSTETEIFTDKSYEDLTNQKIHIDKIDKNSTNFTKKYRLYMWISKDTVIGNTKADYDIDTWNNQVYASIKVNVVGSFEKNCYSVKEIDNNELEITDYFQNVCGTEVIIPETINGKKVTSIGVGSFENKGITEVAFPNSITAIKQAAFLENKLTNVMIPDSVKIIEGFVFQQNANPIETVTIGSGITSFGDHPFGMLGVKTSITINKTCDDILNIPGYSFLEAGMYDYKIIGANGEVCYES